MRSAALRIQMLTGCLAAWVVAMVCLAPSLVAEDAANQPGTKPPAEAPGTTPPKTGGEVWEKLIYLPYKQLQSVFDKEAATVFMPYGQFLKLWEAQRAAAGAASDKPPVGAVITQAIYTGKADKDFAHIEAELTIQVLGKAWVELPIQFGEAAISKMTASDPKVLLQATGNGTYSLLFPAGGEHKVKFDLETRVRTAADGKSLEFDIPATGITSFDLTVPEADQTIEISPQLLFTPVAGEAKATRVRAQLGATKKVLAKWRPRVSTAPVMELLSAVQNVQDVRVADGLIHTKATLSFQVLRGQLNQIQVAVPLKHRILDVSATGLKGWKAVNEAQKQLVTIDLLGGDHKSVSVEILTERPLPEETFDVSGIDDEGQAHGIHALGAVRENGLLVVGHAADLTLSVENQVGLQRVEASEIPENLRSRAALAYKFYTPRFRLQLSARPVEPRILVDHQAQVIFGDDELKLVSKLTYTVEKAGVFDLRLRLPEGIKIDRVDCPQLKEYQVPENADLLIVVLREKTLGQVQLQVQGHLQIDISKKESRLLPLLEPLGVTRETGNVLVYAPQAIEVITDEKGLQAALPLRMDASLQGAPVPNARLASAWTFNRRPVEIPVVTDRKPTRITASVGTVVDVKSETAEVKTYLTYNVEYAGVDTFRFAVPENLAAALQMESRNPAAMAIKQRNRSEPENGWVTFTVVLQREVTGQVPLEIKYDLKPEAAKDAGAAAPALGQSETAGAAARKFAVPLVRVLSTPGKTAEAAAIPVSGLLGEIVVQKDRALSITASAADFETIDVRELTKLPQDGYLAYRYFKQPETFDKPFQLELSSTKHEIQTVVETVVQRAGIDAIVTEDMAVRYRCYYMLRTSERQRLRIDLPKDVQLFDVLVDNKKADLEKGDPESAGKDWEAYSVNVSRSTTADKPFGLMLEFSLPFQARPLRGWGGNIGLPLPRLGGVSATGTGGTAVTQQMRAALFVPKEYVLVGDPPRFTKETESFIDLWRGVQVWGGRAPAPGIAEWVGLPGAQGSVEYQTGTRYVYANLGGADLIEVTYWKMSNYTWIASITLLLIAIVLSLTSWENRLTALLIVALLAALLSLSHHDLIVHSLAAGRFGLLAMAGYWLIHAVNRGPGERRRDIPAAMPPIMGSSVAAVIPPPGVFSQPESTSPASGESSSSSSDTSTTTSATPPSPPSATPPVSPSSSTEDKPSAE